MSENISRPGQIEGTWIGADSKGRVRTAAPVYVEERLVEVDSDLDDVEALALLLVATAPYLRVIANDDQKRLQLHLRIQELGGITPWEASAMEQIVVETYGFDPDREPLGPDDEL